ATLPHPSPHHDVPAPGSAPSLPPSPPLGPGAERRPPCSGPLLSAPGSRGWKPSARMTFPDIALESMAMPYTMEDFERDVEQKILHKMTPERLLAGLTPEQLLAGLTPEQRREVLQSLPPEERLAGLSAEPIRQYLKQLTAGRPAKPRKPRRKK